MKGKSMGEVRDILFRDGEEKEHHTSESLQDSSARPSEWWEVSLKKGGEGFWFTD